MSLSPCRRDAKWIDGQWIANAQVPRKDSPPVTLSPREEALADKLAKYIVAPILLTLLALPVIAVAVLCAGLIGFSTVFIIIGVVWLFADFKRDIVNDISEKIKAQP